MGKQRDYEVTLIVRVIVSNVESEKEAIEGAIGLICDEPREYEEEFEMVNVKDFGESTIQF